VLQQTRYPTGISSVLQKGRVLKHFHIKRYGKILGFTDNMALFLLPVCKDKSVISLFTEIHGNGTAGSEQDHKLEVVLHHTRKKEVV
jgi:hypothetical protein